ncbi:MAG: Na+/H+ antiporter NhaC family protein [Verrucomicrobiota bacterium]
MQADSQRGSAPLWLGASALLVLGISFGLAFWESPMQALWPSLAALLLVVVTRRVIFGLLLGAFGGALIVAEANPLAAFWALLVEHLLPAFGSPWKVGALIFTLLLGGFAAMIEAGGGLRTLVARWLQREGNPRKQLQYSTFGLGFVCFFDGLANAMLLGRVTRSMADRAGVARVKMAYIVDSTSSAIACIAFISTWIGTQLSLIAQGLTSEGADERYSPYGLYFQSIPLNFYCLFTLLLVFLVIARNWNFGSMRRFEREAASQPPLGEVGADVGAGASVRSALIPLAVLVGSILAGFSAAGLLDSATAGEPLLRRIAQGFSTSYGPHILVGGSLLGILAAWLCFPRRRMGETPPARALWWGIVALLVPVLVLIAAWMLGSVFSALGTAEVLVGLIGERLPPALLPAGVFVVCALIAFSTGSSWGTMGIAMPLALPLVFGLETLPIGEGVMLSAAIAAVFSGAVFGDHCSPFSDTTIVSSIASGVAPIDHVKTQLPYALTAAGIAIFAGFLPVGFGWIGLSLAWLPGAVLLIIAAFIFARGSRQ